MRSRTLIPAIVAAISMFALAPAGALAHKHSSPNGRCEISLNTPAHISAGEEVLLFGRLRCTNPAREANQEVKLFHHVWDLPGFTYVQSVKTDSAGFYAIARADGVVETSRSWYVRAQGARSATKRVRVSAQVRLSGPVEGQLLTGAPNRVTFTGTVSPADVGARVILQRQSSLTGNEWHRIDSSIVEASGGFTIVHRFIVPGDANIRVLVRSQARNVPSESNVLAYSISQAQNPQLTIQSSADPIVFGEAAAIGGKVVAGGAQSVTLLARTVRQRGFAPVAQASTNADGEYSFPAQSPIDSTFYRVTSASRPCDILAPHPHRRHPECKADGISSAVLYEGVKDLLTAQASSTTVQAGQTVTFSGTVSPDHTGHVIYLERQNARGPGFHVIQVWFLGTGSTYAISHRFYEPGSRLVRVYVPGGPENQGAASAPFDIAVTPAPASTLIPESPGNATLPSEGQS